MRFRRSTRLLTSWIAVLAFLIATLAPSISLALGSKVGASWVEICTSGGTKWVNADGDAAEKVPAPSSTHPLEHCPYCSLHANAIGLPAEPAGAALALLLPAHDLPIAFLAAPRTLYAWASPRPRAPPLYS